MGAAANNPSCPRCGYDQSGAIAAWERNEQACCPLSGVCAECGSEFAWGDVFSRSKRRVLRHFEVTEHRLIASFFVTTWRALRPWSFWKWADPASPPRWSRIAIGVLGGALLVHVTFALVYAVAGRLAIWIDPPPGFGVYVSHTHFLLEDDLRQALWPWGRPPGKSLAPFSYPIVSPGALMAFITIAFMNALFVIVSVVQRGGRELRQLVRAVSYGFVGAPLSHSAFAVLYAAVAVFEAVETQMRGSREVSWAIREALASYATYVEIGIAIAWWVLWWGTLGAKCLHFRRPWLTAIAIAVVSSLMTLVLFVSVDHLWMWTGEHWQ
jgi:hypothetical protein